MKTIRKSAVAGSFYPEDKEQLAAIVKDLLARVKLTSSLKEKPVILIVPHAGYIYSGQTAAYAFSLAKQFVYKHIVIIGPAHYNLAVKEDKETIGLILNNKKEKAKQIDACGQAGILIARQLARTHQLNGKLLYYDTSQTQSADPSSVVGYAAISFSKE